jgi:hypothetical protein
MLNGSTKEWSTDEIYFQLTDVTIGGRAIDVFALQMPTAGDSIGSEVWRLPAGPGCRLR